MLVEMLKNFVLKNMEKKMKKKETVKPISYWQIKEWKYVPACGTNVLERFKSTGWNVPSEMKVSQK